VIWPHMGSGLVMHCDSCVDFGAIEIVCLCIYLTSFLTCFLPYFFLSLCFISYLLIFLLVYFLIYLSTPSRIDPLRFQVGGHRTRTNLALVFSVNFML